MDPSIYPDPEKWDPERYLPDRAEDKKVPMGYLGWGAGRHPCAGMKVAKLEMRMITAMFIAGYDFTLVNGKDKFPEKFPVPDRNDIQQVRAAFVFDLVFASLTQT
jgi:sterol 14-demethylase